MTIDISKIKPGDKVTLVPFGVTDVINSGTIRLRAEGHGSIYVGANSVAVHHPAPREIKVGDRVSLIGVSSYIGTVKGVAEGEVWVKWGEPGMLPHSVLPAGDFRIVEGDQ